MENTRANRVADQIKREIATILSTKARDPRIGFVTVTEVNVSPDLHHAKVYISVQENQDTKKTFAGLKKSRGFVRGELARRLPLRRVPDLAFLPDNANRGLGQILDLLDQVAQEETFSHLPDEEHNRAEGCL